MTDYPIEPGDIQIDEFWYHEQLGQYRLLARSIEEHLVESGSKYGARAREKQQELEEFEAKHGPIADHENFSSYMVIDGLIADANQFGDEFPNLVRGGLFLSIYGYLEHSLNSLCDQCQTDHDLRVRDLGGSGLKRVATYLKKAYGIGVPDELLRGTDFQLVQMIRNAIVHNAGWIPVGKDRDFIVWSRESLLHHEVDLKYGGYVYLNRNYLEWFITQAQRMFQDLCKELNSYLNKRIQDDRQRQQS